MTYAARETSQYSGLPYELFFFQIEGQSWYLTGADETKTFQGQIYLPEAITHDASAQGIELSSGVLKITLRRDHPIALLFTAYIPASPLWLVIYRAHDGEPESETVTYWTGKVTKVAQGDSCEMECTPEQAALKKRVPTVRYQTACNRVLYDGGCGVQRLAFRLLATLLTVNNTTIMAAAFAAKPDGWFNNGYLELGTERRMIVQHVGNTVTLISGCSALIPGIQVWAYAGCNRAFKARIVGGVTVPGDCVDKFSNGPNFFGFEWMPQTNPFAGVG